MDNTANAVCNTVDENIHHRVKNDWEVEMQGNI
jgi:hypothetical protein